jgi:hypothetical protein
VSQYLELLDFELLKAGAFLMDEMTPHLSAHGVNAGLDDSGQRRCVDQKSGRRAKNI